jgi:hypothetical protein
MTHTIYATKTLAAQKWTVQSSLLQPDHEAPMVALFAAVPPWQTSPHDLGSPDHLVTVKQEERGRR